MGRFDNPSRIVACVASTFPLRAISDVQMEPEVKVLMMFSEEPQILDYCIDNHLIGARNGLK